MILFVSSSSLEHCSAPGPAPVLAQDCYQPISARVLLCSRCSAKCFMLCLRQLLRVCSLSTFIPFSLGSQKSSFLLEVRKLKMELGFSLWHLDSRIYSLEPPLLLFKVWSPGQGHWQWVLGGKKCRMTRSGYLRLGNVGEKVIGSD